MILRSLHQRERSKAPVPASRALETSAEWERPVLRPSLASDFEAFCFRKPNFLPTTKRRTWILKYCVKSSRHCHRILQTWSRLVYHLMHHIRLVAIYLKRSPGSDWIERSRSRSMRRSHRKKMICLEKAQA